MVIYECIISGPESGACWLSDTVLVGVLVNPVPALSLSHEPLNGSAIVLGTPITIVSRTSTINPVRYRYSMSNSLINPLIYYDDFDGDEYEYKIYEFTAGENNEVEVVIINEYGCETRGIEQFMATYDLPNTITPKSETEKNRILLKGYNIQVFNRWGSELYRGTEGWDGKYKGSYVAAGTYFYVLKYEQNGKIIEVKNTVFVKY